MAREFFKNLPDTTTPLNAQRMNAFLNGEEAMGSIVVDDIKSSNLFNINNVYMSSVDYILNGNNSISVTFAAGASGFVKFHAISKDKDTYTISWVSDNANMRLLIFPLDSSDNVITNLSIPNYVYNTVYEGYYKDLANINSEIITFDSSVSKFRIGFVSLKEPYQIFSNIQVKEGSTLTPYTPYKAYGIVESGSNANGEWIKFADGTMICRNNVVLNNLTFAKATQTSVVAQTTGGNNLGDYAQTFVEVQTLFVDCITTPFMKPLDVYNRSNSHVGNCYLWTWNELSGVSGTITYLAIGRWK